MFVLSMESSVFLSVCFLCFCHLAKCDEKQRAAAPLENSEQQGHSAARLLPSVCRHEANGSVEIRLPFMDMELRHERHLHVLRTQQLLLVLHGHELFQLQLAGQAKRLVRLGELAGRVRQQLARTAAVVGWREYLLLAIALEESLEFYQLPQRDLLEGSSRQPHFEPIQEFALAGGGLQQLHLLQPNPEQVLLLLTLNYTQSQARCRTYEWLETYFNPVEELSLPAIKAFQVVGRQPHYIVAGRTLRGQSKLVLTIYELLTPSLRLQRRQSLTVQARHVLAARFRGRNLLFVCPGSADASCIVFRMVDGNFVVYRKHVLRQLQFTHLAASEPGQLLVGARANGEVLVFNTQRLDCYSGFGADTNPSGVHTHRNPQNESFLLITYRRNPSTTLLRMVQLGGANDTATLAAPLEGNDDLSSVQQHRHEFEGAINGLRSLLLRRKVQLDVVRQLLQLLQQQQQQQQTVNVSQAVHVGAGSRVEQVHLQASHLASPTQLQWRMEQLRQQYFRAQARRFTRSFGVGNQSSAGVQELLKARRLHVRNLIYDGELLPGYSLDSGAAPILTIKGQLLTKQLHAQQLFTPQSYKREQRALGEGQTVVRHLRVERINNVAWFDFYDALFLSSRDNEIEGRLVFQARARVVNLQTQLLNGLVVQQLFNLRQPQVVASNIFMSAFFVPKLDAKLVNGLNFAEDIVFRGDNKNTLIKTPVRIYHMSISGDIIVSNATKWPRQMPTPMGSSNLQQYYTGKVILNGSLTVNNVQRDTNGTRLQLNGQSLRAKDLHEDYLLLHKPQNLTTLAFGNAKVTTNTLNTDNINGHPTTEHLITLTDHDAKTEAGEKRVHLIFMNASVNGHIYCSNYSSRLAQLAEDAVRQGETASIDGHKRFEAPLSVDTLSSAVLNGLPSSELVLKSQLSPRFTSAKKFARIVVKEQLDIGKDLQLERLNQVNLSQLLQPAVSLQRLELLELPQLEHLNFQRLNGLAFDELLGKLSSDSAQEEQLLLHKQLIIEGNVRFERPVQLQTINHIHWDEYVQRLVNANANSLLTGQKRFLERVHITDALRTPRINGLDLSALLDDTLLRTTPQSVGGVYSFQRMVASNLDVQQINGVQASTLLDTRQPKLKLSGDLQVPQLSVEGGLRCAALLNNPLPRLAVQLAALRQRSWPRLVVLGDALWNGTNPQQQQQQLDYLRQHAVRRSGGKQTISGHVRLQQPRLLKVETSERFPGQLNVSHLAADALLRRAPGGAQLVEAPQTLLQPVKMRQVRLLDDAQFELLNGIEPGRLNASLYRRSSGQPMGAQLSFRQAPRIGALQLEQGQLNGRQVGGIFQQSDAALWPPVRLQQLKLRQQLQLEEINGMSLEYLLEQRVPLRGAALEQFGTLQFERLVLGERILLRSINGIPVQNAVYKHGQQPQAIAGTKTFEGGIELAGPAHLMQLNGRDLSESYQRSIFTDRDYNIDSLLLDGASFPGGLLAEPAAMEPRQANAKEPRDQLREQLQQLEEQLRNERGNHSQQLLYLEYAEQPLEAIWSTPPVDDNNNNNNNSNWQLLGELNWGSGICQLQQLRAHLSPQGVHLSNVSLASRMQRVSSRSGGLRVKALNYCQQQQQRQRFPSRVHVNCRGHAHTLGLRQHVEALQLIERNGYSLLLISGMDEVRVLHVNHTNCRLSDWQSVRPSSSGRLMKLIQLQLEEAQATWLLLTSGLEREQHLPVVAVHRLVEHSQRFELMQHIGGDYDLAELQDQQLLLSCQSCRHIAVHVYQPDAQQFVPMQQLHLAARIQQLLPFAVANEQHLLVLTMPGSKHFYLFTYGHVEGWQQRTYGHMAGYHWSWPLLRSGQQLTTTTPLLLLCGQRLCSLVNALLD